jgi:hypothetical protein
MLLPVNVRLILVVLEGWQHADLGGPSGEQVILAEQGAQGNHCPSDPAARLVREMVDWEVNGESTPRGRRG